MYGGLPCLNVKEFEALPASMMGLRRISVGRTSGSDLVVTTTKAYEISAASSAESTTTGKQSRLVRQAIVKADGGGANDGEDGSPRQHRT